MKNKISAVRPLLIFLSGVIAAFPLALKNGSPLIFISFVPSLLLFLNLSKSDNISIKGFRIARRFYGFGFLFSMGYFMCVFSWFISLYPLDFAGFEPGSAIAVVLIAWIGLPFLQSVFFAPVFPLFAFLSERGIVRRRPFLSPILFSCLFTVFFFFQTLTWGGVPWGVPTIALYRAPVFLQSASLFGGHFVIFLIAFINFCIAGAVHRFRHCYDTDGCRLYLLLAVSVFMANALFGIIHYNIPTDKSVPLRITVLQANVSSREKWSTTGFSYQQYYDMAEEAAQNSDIVVMPETAIPAEIDADSHRTDELSKLARDTDTVILIGAFFLDMQSDEEKVPYYTSVFAFYPDGGISDTVYHKRHLVPFGEFVPFDNVIAAIAPPLSELEMFDSQLTPGTETNLFNTEYGKIGSLICFDSVFPSLARESVADGAGLLVMSTNDSWFGESTALYQHNAESVIRAIENGRYFATSANTGISAIIDPRGKIISESTPLEKTMITATVYMQSHRTPYTAVGDVFIVVSFIFIISLSVYPIVKKHFHLFYKLFYKKKAN